MSKLVYVCIPFLVLFCFGLSLTAEFVFDDSKAIVSNEDVLNDKVSFWDLFKHDFWGSDVESKYSHKSYRPLTILCFRTIRQVSNFIEGPDSLNPFYFHLTNLSCYCILCCILHKTLNFFLNDPIVNLSKKLSNKLSTYTTILFTIHPIHCEAVCSCVGLADILSGLFSLVALDLHLSNNRLLYSFRITGLGIAKYCSLSFLTMSLISVSFVLKEQGITFLAILSIVNILQLIKLRQRESSNINLLYCQLILFAVIFVALTFLRIWMMNFSLPKFDVVDNPSWYIDNFIYRVINYIYVYYLNAFIIICPIWLCFDWSMGCVPLINSLVDYRIIFVILFLTLTVIFCLRTLLITNLRILVLFSMFFILPFIPSSNVFFQVGFVIAERNLFMPILGYLLILSYCLILSSRLDLLPKKITNYGTVVLLLVLTCRSFNRTMTWRNERTLYMKDIDVCPYNAKIWYNMAKIASDEGEISKAIQFYDKSLELYPNYTSALNNLGNIYKDIGETGKAKELLVKAVKIDLTFAAAWMNLAIVEMSLRNYNSSELYFLNSLIFRPRHANTNYNLGNLYLQLKDFPKAEKHFHEAVRLDPKFIKSWKNLILLLQKSNQIEKAFNFSLSAFEVNPADPELNFLLGSLYGMKNNFESAVHHFEYAIKERPNVALYHYNLAVLYHQNKVYHLAKQSYEATLKIDPDYINAIKQLKILKSKLGSN